MYAYQKENPEPPKEKNSSPPKVSEINNVNDLPKTLLTKKTEDNYTLMMKYFNYRCNNEKCIKKSYLL